MRAARMPDLALGRIAMVADPDMGVQVFESVIANHVITVTDHLEHDHVLAVGEDEGPFLAGRGVKRMVKR